MKRPPPATFSAAKTLLLRCRHGLIAFCCLLALSFSILPVLAQAPDKPASGEPAFSLAGFAEGTGTVLVSDPHGLALADSAPGIASKPADTASEPHELQPFEPSAAILPHAPTSSIAAEWPSLPSPPNPASMTEDPARLTAQVSAAPSGAQALAIGSTTSTDASTASTTPMASTDASTASITPTTFTEASTASTAPTTSTDDSNASTPTDPAAPDTTPAPAAQPAQSVQSVQPVQPPVKPDKPARIPVLNYHSITVDPGNPATITPEKFEAQMRYLHANGYNTLTLKQFSDMIEGIDKGPDKPILLTFDDGYADNYEHALPLFKELGFHATLFVSPGTVEDGYFLNWDQIKEMHQAGWDVQPHGMTHPHLPRLSAKDQAYEITEARAQIESMLGTTADIYCYPYGQWNAATLRILKEHHFRYAFTIEQGFTVPSQDRFKLKRIFVNGEESIEKWKSTFEK